MMYIQRKIHNTCVIQRLGRLDWNWEGYQLWRFVEFKLQSSPGLVSYRDKGKPQIYLCKQEIGNLFRPRLSLYQTNMEIRGCSSARESAAFISSAFVWKGRNPICSISARAISRRRGLQRCAQLKFPHLGNGGGGSWIFHMGAGQCVGKRWIAVHHRRRSLENVRCALAQFIHICECIMKERAAQGWGRYESSHRALWHTLVPPNLREKYENFVLSCFAAKRSGGWNDELPGKFSRVLIDHKERNCTKEIDTSHYHTFCF